ncbi:CBS domain-containing protein CBSX5-like [Phragmites australis]|uniref:CBS domain-containing protein CBSX5-like n=1 Tax=Phragmites australis TaxID=29695 RepID=UPI002D788777|nr:CBS domain-containing protein CBSX5-like [Phragmites australis]
MAASLLSHVVSDLCIGRPKVLTLTPSTPVAAALAALRAGADPFAFVDAEPSSRAKRGAATAYVKVSVAGILCYVCGDAGNLGDPAAALSRPVSAIAAVVGGVAHRVDPQTSLLDAIDVLLTDGCQGLLVPLHARARRKHHHVPSSDAVTAAEYCVLTQQDIARHLFGSISHFSPVAALTVASLGLVRRDVHAVHVDDDALDAIPLLRRSISDGTAVAVIADDDALVREICPGVLGSCDVESVSAAFAALSAGDVMTYIDCSLSQTSPEFPLRAVRAQLKDRGLDAMAELMDTWNAASAPFSPSSSSSSTSSDEESTLGRARRPRRVLSGSFGWRSTEDVVACHAGSSLVAVMAQALAHRVGYVWVVDEASGALVGVVRFADVLSVLQEHLRP